MMSYLSPSSLLLILLRFSLSHIKHTHEKLAQTESNRKPGDVATIIYWELCAPAMSKVVGSDMIAKQQ